MSGSIDVVGFGVNAIDQVIRLYRIPDADAKVVCPPERYALYPGGVMGNTLTGLARLGLRAGYIGRFGDDDYGLQLTALAEEDGVDLSACETVPGGNTPWTWITVDEQGERSITLFPNLLWQVDTDFIRERADYIRAARLLHLEASELPLAPTLEAARIARAAGVAVSFDLDIPASDLVEKAGLASWEELEELISLSDYFIPCIGGARELSSLEDPLQAAAELQRRYDVRVVALSHGAEGCFVASSAGAFRSPAFPITPVDGTGSGDAFHAGMIFGLVRGWSLEETARFANACGALNTIVMGARSGMTGEAEVRRFMQKYT